MKGYDILAPYYDRLAVLFVGKHIQHAQLKMLSHLSASKKLLILGGGTGWILPHLFRVNPKLEIHWIDTSEKMIARARTCAGNYPLIKFINGNETNVPDRDYDAVLTHFYVDLFTDEQLGKLIGEIKTRLTSNANWLVTDFEVHTTLQQIKVSLMYWFFRLVTGLKTRALPLWYKVFVERGFNVLETHSTKRGFIKSVAFHVITN